MDNTGADNERKTETINTQRDNQGTDQTRAERDHRKETDKQETTEHGEKNPGGRHMNEREHEEPRLNTEGRAKQQRLKT